MNNHIKTVGYYWINVQKTETKADVSVQLVTNHGRDLLVVFLGRTLLTECPSPSRCRNEHWYIPCNRLHVHVASHAWGSSCFTITCQPNSPLGSNGDLHVTLFKYNLIYHCFTRSFQRLWRKIWSPEGKSRSGR